MRLPTIRHVYEKEIYQIDIFEGMYTTIYLRNKEGMAQPVELRVLEDGTPEIFAPIKAMSWDEYYTPPRPVADGDRGG
jgi:hypothetical protein